MNYLEKAQDLQGMMGQGQMMDAFEKYYHDNVVVEEPTGEKREGKDAQRKAIHDWQEMVQEMHGGGVTGITADEANGVTMVESWVDITMKGGNRVKMEEVAVQKWDGDQIIHERFYYNPSFGG